MLYLFKQFYRVNLEFFILDNLRNYLRESNPLSYELLEGEDAVHEVVNLREENYKKKDLKENLENLCGEVLIKARLPGFVASRKGVVNWKCHLETLKCRTSNLD